VLAQILKTTHSPTNIYMNIYNQLTEHKKQKCKCFALLLDPDKIDFDTLPIFIKLATDAKVDYIFIGGSLMINNYLDLFIKTIKSSCQIPVVLFPGSSRQLSYQADGLLFLSLISGRNADLLIGKHVETAPFIKMSGLEVLPTGYMLIDGGKPTSVSYMSNTNPIPKDKNDIAVCTALAGELLGLKLIYMDAGSGAISPISTSMIRAVAQSISIPLIIGGGIRTVQEAQNAARAGADIVVVGNAIEKQPSLITDMAQAIQEL
jgi:phosphoglycerol geranylgeranyltransferase